MSAALASSCSSNPISSLLRRNASRRLKSATVAEVLLLGRLGDQDDVGEIGDQLLALGLRRHPLHVGAHVLLGEREVALPDIDAVDAGDHRVGPDAAGVLLDADVLRAAGHGRQDEQQRRDGGERDRAPARRGAGRQD